MRGLVLSAVSVAVLSQAVVFGQDQTTSPGRSSTATPAPDPGVFHQDELTGDWNGVRTEWEDKGVELDSSLTQFYQGVASGGIETGSEYNGTAQATLTFDLGKLAGWNDWSAEIKAETRFGGPLLTGTGTISRVNVAATIPGVDGTVFAVTAVNVTKLFLINLQEEKFVAVSFGRYNLVDLVDEDFFAGNGTERFMNIAQIDPLTASRQVPLVTNMVSLAYLRGGEPFVTLAVIDPNDDSTDPGLSGLFADGVTFAPAINTRAKYFGRTAKHSVGGAITTKKYTLFDAIRQATLPGPSSHPVEPHAGSWSVSYTFQQYVVERSKGDGWGLFGQVSRADPSTSPIATFFDAGLAGNGLFRGRPRDEFGIAYAYTEISNTLKANLDLLSLGGRLRAEHQLEAFYNLYLTPWLQLTGDLQILRPNRPVADTAIVPAVRLRVVF